MNTKKVIEAVFVTCISVGYVTASDPMAQNLLENSAPKQQSTVSTEQVRPVTRDEKVRKPIEVVDIDPDSGLPIFKIEKYDDSSNEYFGEEENEEEEFYDEILPSLMKSSKFRNQKNEYVKLTPAKKEKESPKKKNAK